MRKRILPLVPSDAPVLKNIPTKPIATTFAFAISAKTCVIARDAIQKYIYTTERFPTTLSS